MLWLSVHSYKNVQDAEHEVTSLWQLDGERRQSLFYLSTVVCHFSLLFRRESERSDELIRYISRVDVATDFCQMKQWPYRSLRGFSVIGFNYLFVIHVTVIKITLNNRMIIELWIGKDMEGSGCRLIWETMPGNSAGNEENHENRSDRDLNPEPPEHETGMLTTRL